MDEKAKHELEAAFSKLKPQIQKTVEWWIETDSGDSSNPLFEIAECYRKEFKKRLPKPGGKKAPSHVQRELKEIQSAFNRLRKVLSADLSWEARETLLSSGDAWRLKGWIPQSWNEYLGEGPFAELGRIINLLDSVQSEPKKKPHSFLIRWMATKLKRAGKPRSHVLPIAGAIHSWAAREKMLPGEEWGESFLDLYWPKRTMGG